MKTLMSLLLLSGVIVVARGQTNAPVVVTPSPVLLATNLPVRAQTEAPIAPSQSVSADTVTSTALERLPRVELKVPVDGIEGRKANYTGVIPQAAADPSPRGLFRLINPFAALSPAERIAMTNSHRRVAPRGFADERRSNPAGLVIFSAETR